MTELRALVTTAVCVGSFGALMYPAYLYGQSREEGIKVHGDWVIEVRDPDGTLEHRRKFKNALTATGKEALALVLSRAVTLTLWRVQVHSAGGLIQPCADGIPQGCDMTEPTATSTSAAVFKNLTVTRTTANEIVLKGSFVVANTTTIGSVGTALNFTQGGSLTGRNFTSATLPSPIPVEESQSVSVEVTLGFD